MNKVKITEGVFFTPHYVYDAKYIIFLIKYVFLQVRMHIGKDAFVTAVARAGLGFPFLPVFVDCR